jgi:polyisoprenoid-binding protein YceI
MTSSRRHVSLLALGALALLASPAFAQDAWVVDKNHSEVGFQIRHFVTKVRGRFADFTGTIVADAAKPEASSVEFAIRTASIDTAVEGRDKDLRSPRFFDVEKYPEITFKSSKVKMTSKDHFDVTGTLTMHGVSKEITLPVSYLGSVPTKTRDGREGAKAGFETSLTLERKDFGITWNATLDNGGLMLGDDVLININLETNKQEPKPATP